MFNNKYLDKNQSKIKTILNFYGHQFMSGKKILDLGCGQADISGVFRQLGADVTAVDARQEQLIIAGKKFPGLKTIRADLDRVYPFQNKKFDLILNLDLINYLQDYENHLKLICNSTEHLVLETCVCDSNDPNKKIIIKGSHNLYDGSLNGITSYPSSAAIEKILTSCNMSFRRLDNKQFNSKDQNYDWVPRNNNSYNINNRRIWFCVKVHSAMQFAPKLQTNSSPNVVVNNIVLQGSNILSSQDIIKLKSKNSTNVPIINKPKSNLKIALCISGHLRTFESAYPSVKKYILDKLNCDVFIHTWDTLGHRHRSIDGSLSHQLTNNLINKINTFYNPKKLIIEKNKHFAVSKIMINQRVDNRDVVGVQSMYYKIQACNLLKKQYELQNNFTYDCVIRFRGDLLINNTLPIVGNQDFNYLYLPTIGHFAGLNDQIAFGNSKIMDDYSDLFSNINKYLEDGCIMNPEKLLDWHINKMQIPIHKTDIQYVIVRSNGTVQDNQILENALGFGR